MQLQKQNCWDHMNCGREPGGYRAVELGICRAAIEDCFDGLNSGKNGGRICWAIAGTFCGGKTQGSFVEKKESCLNCDFFRVVQEEEGILRTNTFSFTKTRAKQT